MIVVYESRVGVEGCVCVVYNLVRAGSGWGLVSGVWWIEVVVVRDRW